MIPGVISRGFPQLKAFLGLAGPDSAREFGSIVQPVVDLSAWWNYAAEIEVQGTGSVGAGFTGEFTTAGLTPPAGSAWILRWAGLQWNTIPAATTITAGVVIVNVNNSRVFPIGPQFTTPAIASLQIVDALGGGNGTVFLPPGYRVSPWVVANNNAGAATVFLNLRVAQFPAST